MKQEGGKSGGELLANKQGECGALSFLAEVLCVCGGLLHKVKQDELACVLNNNSSSNGCGNDKERRRGE